MAILFVDFLKGKFLKHAYMECVISIEKSHFKYSEYFAIHFPD